MIVSTEIHLRVAAAVGQLVEAVDDAELYVLHADLCRRVAAKLKSTPRAVDDHVVNAALEMNAARAMLNGRWAWLGMRYRDVGQRAQG